MLKKIFRIGCICLLLILFSGCTVLTAAPVYEGADLHIVTTIFPPYDFARNITSGAEHVCVQQLLPPGTESHTFDPTPADILAVRNCDVFIYTGGESDAWVKTLLSAADNGDMRVIRMMDCVEAVEESVVPGMTHSHGHEHDHGNVREPAHTDSDHIEYDEHVWTDPHNAIRITEAITQVLAAADPAHAQEYLANSAAYTEALSALDTCFHALTEDAKRHEVVFGDRFPFRYLCDAYGISYRAAFPGCAAESEPSAATMIALIEKIKALQIPVVFTIEMSSQRIAEAIAGETGCAIRTLHSCHNRTAEEAASGETYLSIMYRNAEILGEALS